MISSARRFLSRDLLVAASALALLFAGVYGAYRMVAQKVEAEAVTNAIGSAERHAQYLAEYWANVEDRITGLHSIAKRVVVAELAGDNMTMQDSFGDLQDAIAISIPGIARISAVDPHGFPSWITAEQPDANAIINGRDYVRAILRDGRNSFVGQPISDTAPNYQAILFAAAQRDKAGNLMGITVVHFDLARAEALAKKIIRNDHDVVTLLRRDGTVLARSNGRLLEKKLAISSSFFDPPRPDGVQIGRGESPVDNIRRIAVRQEVPGGDLVVIVALDEAEALHDARSFNAKLRIGAYILCFLLALLACALVIIRREGIKAQNQRLTAASLAARDRFLHEISDRSQDLIAVLDENLRYVFLNCACCTVMNVQPDEMIGKPIGSRVHPKYRDEHYANLASMRHGAGPYQFDTPVIRGDGGLCWLRYQFSPIALPSASEEIRNGWYLVASDITARVDAEETLVQTIANLRAVAKSGPGAIYWAQALSNGTSRLLFFAGSEAGFLGYSDEEWITEGFPLSIVHPDDVGRYRRRIPQTIRSGPRTDEYRLRHKDGHYAWVRNSAVLSRREDNTVWISGYALDVSAEKEQAERLEQAQRMLSLGELASGVGHELGQPLAAISLAAMGTVMALERGSASMEWIQEKLHRILRMSERAGAIIDNMRVFGRKEAQNTAWTRLPKMVSDAVAMLQDRLEQEAIQIRLDLPEDLPAVLVPPVMFEQVLINLIANACDAYGSTTGNSPRIISIEGQASDTEIRLRVRDQAGGVPADVIGHVFEPFFTTKGPNRGTGLGLSVCYGIVRQAGGTLSVQNEDGGAVFQITLPLSAEVGTVQAELLPA